MTLPPTHLRLRLAQAKAAGAEFTDVWAHALAQCCQGFAEAEEWREVLAATKDTWQRAYYDEALPGENALAFLGEDCPELQDERERFCARCTAPIVDRGPLARFCSDDCRRRSHESKRRHAIARGESFRPAAPRTATRERASACATPISRHKESQ